MNFLKPDHVLRRSPLYRRHIQDGAVFEECSGELVVGSYQEAEVELGLARNLSICDLTTLSRGGLTGPGATAYLSSGYVDLPKGPNQSRLQVNGDTVARLSQDEYLYLKSSSLMGASSDVAAWTGNSDAKAYPLPRQDSHCWFVLTGAHSAVALSKLCAIDFRNHKFENGRVAQTSLAKVSAIILRCDLAAAPGFFVLANSTATEYLWDCMTDAMHEFGGAAVGVGAIKALLKDN